MNLPQCDLPTGWIDLAREFFGVERIEVLTGGADHGLLEILQQKLAINVPLAGNGVDEADGFGIHLKVAFEALRIVKCRSVERSEKQRATALKAVTRSSDPNHASRVRDPMRPNVVGDQIMGNSPNRPEQVVGLENMSAATNATNKGWSRSLHMAGNELVGAVEHR